jgi:hypothetical protein
VSITAVHIPSCALELCHDRTTNRAPQLATCLQRVREKVSTQPLQPKLRTSTNFAYTELRRGVFMSQKYAKFHPLKTIVWKYIGAIHRQVVLPEPLVMSVPILIQYRVSLSTSPVPQLQLRHVQWLVYGHSVGSRTHNCLRCSVHFSRKHRPSHQNPSASG